MKHRWHLLAVLALTSITAASCTTQPDPPPPPDDPAPILAPCGTFVCLEVGCPVLPPDCP